MKKQCEELGENLHEKIRQARGLGIIKKASLHHFSDASEEGYGQSTYLRLLNVSVKIHCCFLMGKSRVTPKK